MRARSSAPLPGSVVLIADRGEQSVLRPWHPRAVLAQLAQVLLRESCVSSPFGGADEYCSVSGLASSQLLGRHPSRDEDHGECHCEGSQRGDAEQVDPALVADRSDEFTQGGSRQVVPLGRSANDLRVHT